MPVAVRLQLEVVADVHRRGQEADFLGELLAQPRMRLQELAVLALVDQRDQAVADLQPEHVDRRHVVPARLLSRRASAPRGVAGAAGRSLLRLAALAADHPVSHAAERCGEQQEGQVGMPGIRPRTPMIAPVSHQHLRVGEELADDLLADVLVVATRLTTRPAAVEMISAGICATRPSPMVSRV
jgi:hypothetical protein